MVGVPTVTLNNGVEIPRLGLGTSRGGDEETRRLVRDALSVGFRLIDTAAKYENEVGVGQGIADSRIPREGVFVGTKLRGAEQGYESTGKALDASLGAVPIPKSTNVERLRQNLEVFDFELTDDDLAKIASLETGERVSDQDPRTHEEF